MLRSSVDLTDDSLGCIFIKSINCPGMIIITITSFATDV